MRRCGWCGTGWDVPLGEPGSCPSMRLDDGRVLRLLWKCHLVEDGVAVFPKGGVGNITVLGSSPGAVSEQ